MYFCNKCDKSFSRKDNLTRHHRAVHEDEASFKFCSKDLSDEKAESQFDTDGEMDDDSVASTSSSDEDDIEDELNDEDTSTTSLNPLRNAWATIGEDAESCTKSV